MRIPTLDYAQSLGLRDLPVVCSRCQALFVVRLSAIDLPGHTSLDLIPTLRPIACEECGGPSEVDLEEMGLRKE